MGRRNGACSGRLQRAGGGAPRELASRDSSLPPPGDQGQNSHPVAPLGSHRATCQGDQEDGEVKGKPSARGCVLERVTFSQRSLSSVPAQRGD